MLSPSNPAQKSLSEEDDSGSDAGSAVSLEPETDRFGFILTNGAKAGSVGPPPELVRQRETKWINIILQWDSMLLKKTSKVKVQCQKGIPASLRAKCWPLLCAASDRMKQNENLYKTLDSQPALKSWVDLIERDLDRQFPFHEMFLCKDGHGQQGLFRVLKAYTQYQPEEGYCQAQGPVAAVLLMNMPAEEAFWCLVQISQQYLPGYYSPLLEGVLFDAGMLTWVLKRTCPAAHKHLQHHGVEPLMFATDWLMCLFVRHLPFNTLLRVWDLFFCYGVRVLLQVAVVLVRRVLGHAEQRKQCQGQMETLEQLRGIREQVHDEDDAFIAEVCSVPLSAKDLAKQTEKELQKWRKERPASTFDPRGRCKGYRMAWARVRQTIEDRDRKARERGNLSVPLSRSASTLSLSPSLLHKRLRKGGKAHTGEGGGKIVRHLSMGAKDDWRNWNELNFKKVQGVLEETDADEHMKLTNRLQSAKKELSEEPVKMDKTQNISSENTEETEMVKEQKDQLAAGIMEKVVNQPTEKEDDIILLGHKDKTDVEDKPYCSPAKVQNVEKELQPIECTSDHGQQEELGPDSQSQVLEEQSHKDQDQETERQESESEPLDAAEEKQGKTPRDNVADTYADKEIEVGSGEEQIILSDVQVSRIEQQMQTGTVIEVLATRIETIPCSETDIDIEAAAFTHPNLTLETENQEEVATEADKSSLGDTVEEKYHSTESLVDESNTHIETETEGKVEESAATQDELETERVHTDSKTETKTAAETLILSLPACIQHQKDTDTAGDAEREVEIPVEDDTADELCEVFAPCSSKRGDTPELQEEKEEIIFAVHSEAEGDNDEAQAKEAQEEPWINVETPDSAALTVKEETSNQTGTVNLTTEPDGTTSSEEISISQESVQKEPEIQVTTGPFEDKVNVQENTAEEETFISTEMTENPNIDNNPEEQNKDNCSLVQASRNRSSRSSGDFCMRKSSSSRGSRLARKLSEDLFTVPTDTSQVESVPNHAEVKHPDAQSTPEAVNTATNSPEMTQSLEVSSSLSVVVTERTVAEQGPPAVPKRFGLFSRLRGEQPKKAKEKGSQKMQVPRILIQDFSDGTGIGRLVEEEADEKLSSRERRRRRREHKRKEKEEEKIRKLKEKQTEKERERRKPQTRETSSQVQKGKGSNETSQLSKTLRYSASYAESYF